MHKYIDIIILLLLHDAYCICALIIIWYTVCIQGICMCLCDALRLLHILCVCALSITYIVYVQSITCVAYA